MTQSTAEIAIMVPMITIAMILQTLATPTPRTSAEIRQDRDSIDMAALEARVAELEAERKKLLLAGSNEALRTNAAGLVDARLDVERGAALIAELDRLAAEAEAREAAEKLQADAEAARREADKLAELTREIDDLADTLRERLALAAVSSAAVARWNAKAARHPSVRSLPLTPIEAVRARVLGKVA